MSIPLSIFDLVPVAEGQSPQQAVAASVELARSAERLGYTRLWYGEHHFNPGVIGYNPALLMALAGSATSTLRVGSGAVLAGQRSALAIAEDFALLQATLGDRVDLGIGRAPVRGKRTQSKDPGSRPPAMATKEAQQDRTTEEGLLLPAAPDLSGLGKNPRMQAIAELLIPEGTPLAPYGEFIDQLISFLNHTTEAEGVALPSATPELPTPPQVWVLGSSAGESAKVAGERGLRFGANYHVAPSNVTDAVDHYRASFQPSDELAEPYVIVSAEVLVADSEAEAHRLGAGYDQWVYSIRSGQGAIPYPAPDSPAAAPLGAEAADLVRDRTSTRFLGTADQVAEQLDVLQRATGADELLISTTTHDPAVRLRSFELLADVT
ncbi:LLM class flavin-dependent oxidoreductase [Nesterenkonia sp. MY13]|uniref:LLM class flavin-dependent oxidoreductase n=1 Tax=Nesterenkonia sedimenti TaxID=1463632 RepID=A0A7X8YEW1_9MICC|nr:LLM class flavin-dependent oxidoreductase [Nesterenkonia sedimenti]NLS10781.1 LLM class flavin-dependent oxidoreductase [Nesterenkonia sedimenti]